jgi:hypothetical protein
MDIEIEKKMKDYEKVGKKLMAENNLPLNQTDTQYWAAFWWTYDKFFPQLKKERKTFLENMLENIKKLDLNNSLLCKIQKVINLFIDNIETHYQIFLIHYGKEKEIYDIYIENDKIIVLSREEEKIDLIKVFDTENKRFFYVLRKDIYNI